MTQQVSLNDSESMAKTTLSMAISLSLMYVSGNTSGPVTKAMPLEPWEL
jgi:hypothetical protein